MLSDSQANILTKSLIFKIFTTHYSLQLREFENNFAT